MTFKRLVQSLILIPGALALGACSMVPAPAAETYDGLVLVPNARFGTVYKRPGADFSGYEAYGLARCDVAFRKDWMRDQNRSSLDLSNRVTQKDVDRIRDRLGDDCDRYFRQALEQAPPYRLVESFDNGEQVLVLRPAIINLDIAAPDTGAPGRQRSYTTEAGQMTLLLEVLDGTTGEILLRVVDHQHAGETSYLRWTNSITNQAEARRILGRWASQLRTGLDEATASARITE